MKKIILVFALTSLFTNLRAQNFEWAKREGLWAYDYGYGIANDKSGNIYLAGKYEMNAKFSGTTVSCEGNHDIYVAKYTPSGALSWIRTAGGYTGDYATCIACDGSYVYVGGEIEGSNALIKFPGSPITLTCKGSNDIMLAKYDLNGNLIWAKRAGDVYYDKARGISYDNVGNVYIVGLFNNTATFGGTTTITGYGENDIFVAKYDANGNFLWVKKAGGPGRDEGKAIKCDAAGNVYICGMFKGAANFSGQILNSPDAYWNMFVAKYYTDGTLAWVKSAGGNWDDVAWGITMDDAGKIYVAGEYNSPINFGGISLSSSGRADVFVTCYNSSGTALWAKKGGGSGLDRARAIGTDGSNLYITGQFGGTATFGGTTLNAADGADIFNACLDNNGNFKWANSVGGAPDALEDLGYESGDAICADRSGNVYSSGALLDGGTFGNASLTTYGRTDIFLTKIKTAIAPPSCSVPSGLTVESITTTSATVKWTAVTNAISYDIQYRITGTTTWISTNTTVNSKALSGLSSLTTFEFQVRTVCSSGASAYSSIQTFTTTGTGTGTELIAAGSSWKYLDNGTNQGTNWKSPTFSDATWKTGNAELGYGDGGEATVVSYGPSSTNKYITTYFRKTFNVIDKSTISGLELSLVRDDGAVVYINGVEVYKNNLPPGIIYYNTLAPTFIDGTAETTFIVVNISSSSLVNGNNVIAVEIHQNAVTSSDISFNLKLKTLSGSRIMDTRNENDSIAQNIVFENTYDMIVYPNPNTGQFNLELCIDDLQEKNVLIEVTNSFGKVVHQKQAQKINGCVKEAIELDSSLPVGVYILKVTIDDTIQTSRMLLAR